MKTAEITLYSFVLYESALESLLCEKIIVGAESIELMWKFALVWNRVENLCFFCCGYVYDRVWCCCVFCSHIPIFFTNSTFQPQPQETTVSNDHKAHTRPDKLLFLLKHRISILVSNSERTQHKVVWNCTILKVFLEKKLKEHSSFVTNSIRIRKTKIGNFVTFLYVWCGIRKIFGIFGNLESMNILIVQIFSKFGKLSDRI